MHTATETVEQMHRRLAVAAREALRQLDYPGELLDCLPGEAERADCDLPVHMHLIAFFAMLNAMMDHYVSHLDTPIGKALVELVYTASTTELQERCNAKH